MHARDAAGRRVSLLNDDRAAAAHAPATSYHTTYQSSYHSSYFLHSTSTSPHTPELLRSDSYDSQMSIEPISPMTPVYDHGRHHHYASVMNASGDPRIFYDDDAACAAAADRHLLQTYGAGSKRPRTLSDDSRSTSYDEDAGLASPAGERSGKRYPCRFRDTHGCEKTFTTSGHASRHSKIHTAEKAVPCTFQGCSKKFTRADNMKQHLETHYKEKSRSSSSRSPTSSSSPEKSSSKSLSVGKSSSRSKITTTVPVAAPLPSPADGGVWDMRNLQLPILSRPSTTRTPSALDALAMVAAREGA